MTASSQKKSFGPATARFTEDPERPGIEVSQWFEECPECEGTGEIKIVVQSMKIGQFKNVKTPCQRCSGTGWAEVKE